MGDYPMKAGGSNEGEIQKGEAKDGDDGTMFIRQDTDTEIRPDHSKLSHPFQQAGPSATQGTSINRANENPALSDPPVQAQVRQMEEEIQKDGHQQECHTLSPAPMEQQLLNEDITPSERVAHHNLGSTSGMPPHSSENGDPEVEDEKGIDNSIDVQRPEPREYHNARSVHTEPDFIKSPSAQETPRPCKYASFSKRSWAREAPLSFRLSHHSIGDPDELLPTRTSPHLRRTLSEMKDVIRAENIRARVQLATMTLRQTNSEGLNNNRGGQKSLDNPTSFFRAFPGSERLWPYVKIERIRDASFLSSCNNKMELKLMSRFLTEHALDQIARYDPSCDLECKWALTTRNLYCDEALIRLREQDRQEGEMCSCIPVAIEDHPTHISVACGDRRCENRAMNIECVRGKCGSGAFCKNMRLQKQEFPKVEIRKFEGKGYGLVAGETIYPGTMIGEYCGEVVTGDMFQTRLTAYQGEKDFYFMVLSNKLFIDASRRGGIVRLINHSCDPNCETEKWNAGREPHVAVVAKREIRPCEEITFSYEARPLCPRPTRCMCNSENCRMWLSPLPDSSTSVGLSPIPADLKMGFDQEKDDIVALKMQQARSDLMLAEEMLTKIYNIVAP